MTRGRPTEFVMRVAVAKLRELSLQPFATGCVEGQLLQIPDRVNAPEQPDHEDTRDNEPNWPAFRLHVECSTSSQQRRFDTMARSKKSVNRRGFLKGAAAGAAAGA